MALDKRIFLIGLLITSLIFLAIVFSNGLINDKREQTVAERMDSIVKEYEDMQTLLLMAEFFGEEATCVALESMLQNMNKGLWNLGIKIDSYRQVTEEFMKDPFYLEQKREFNRKEVLYFSMLKKMKEMCGVNQTIVSFFYKKKEDCPDCDAQSFVLSDIRHDLEKLKKDEELAIFSFDANMGLPAINLLIKFYNVDSYPCLVIGNEPHCKLYNKKELTNVLCEKDQLSFCPITKK